MCYILHTTHLTELSHPEHAGAEPDQCSSGHHPAQQDEAEDEDVEHQADTATDLHLKLCRILKVLFRESEDVIGPRRWEEITEVMSYVHENDCMLFRGLTERASAKT